MSRPEVTCPGCDETVYLDPRHGWRSDAAGDSCAHPMGHGFAVLDRLGRAFHEAGIQVLKDTGMDRALTLPRWSEVNDLQRTMAFAGVTAVLLEAAR